MKKIKIIATVGPACKTGPKIKSLVQAGVDIFRINMSHQNSHSLKEWCRRIRQQRPRRNSKISILVDLQGPRIRTGRLKRGVVALKQNQKIAIRIGQVKGNSRIISTPFEPLLDMAVPGRSIFIDNGLLELRVLKVRRPQKQIDCRVITGGRLGENKGINLPNAAYPSTVLTAKDREDLRAAAELNVDWIALSFVQSAEDLNRVKDELKRLGKKIPVMAKIERNEALGNIQGILKMADGMMVARGDLGIEAGVEQVPVLQKLLIRRANQKKVFAVTATEMLESMIERPRPTRAEASDVANAIWDGTDAVMLSGETAIGKYPVLAVEFLIRIIRVAQKAV